MSRNVLIHDNETFFVSLDVRRPLYEESIQFVHSTHTARQTHTLIPLQCWRQWENRDHSLLTNATEKLNSVNDMERTCHMGRNTRSMSLEMTMTRCVAEWETKVVMTTRLVTVRMGTPPWYRDTCPVMASVLLTHTTHIMNTSNRIQDWVFTKGILSTYHTMSI